MQCLWCHHRAKRYVLQVQRLRQLRGVFLIPVTGYPGVAPRQDDAAASGTRKTKFS